MFVLMNKKNALLWRSLVLSGLLANYSVQLVYCP